MTDKQRQIVTQAALYHREWAQKATTEEERARAENQSHGYLMAVDSLMGPRSAVTYLYRNVLRTGNVA